MNETYKNGNDDLFDFLKPHYSETDKLLRAIDNICGTYYLIFNIRKYPLSSERKCWDRKILNKDYNLQRSGGGENIWV